MKSIMRKIDRYCALHPRFGISNLMLYIVIGTGVVWLIGMMDQSHAFINALTFNAQKVFTQGQVWRLFTFVLIPESGDLWQLIALYFYYFIGSTLERQWGSGKFTIFYMVGMLFNILFGVVFWLFGIGNMGVTATYLNLSMFFAFATLYPDMRVLLFFIIPIKMKWLGIANAVVFLLAVIRNPFPINLLPLVAILNYLLFCGGWLFDYVRPAKIKQQKKTIDFKKAAKEYNKKQAARPYTRKCEVCGKTDRDYPNLEFRFCSKCQGYHCFCVDHINSHIHFKE